MLATYMSYIGANTTKDEFELKDAKKDGGIL